MINHDNILRGSYHVGMDRRYGIFEAKKNNVETQFSAIFMVVDLFNYLQHCSVQQPHLMIQFDSFGCKMLWKGLKPQSRTRPKKIPFLQYEPQEIEA